MFACCKVALGNDLNANLTPILDKRGEGVPKSGVA